MLGNRHGFHLQSVSRQPLQPFSTRTAATGPARVCSSPGSDGPIMPGQADHDDRGRRGRLQGCQPHRFRPWIYGRGRKGAGQGKALDVWNTDHNGAYGHTSEAQTYWSNAHEKNTKYAACWTHRSGMGATTAVVMVRDLIHQLNLAVTLYEQELAARDLFAKVILIGRREVPLPEGVPAGKFVSSHPLSMRRAPIRSLSFRALSVPIFNGGIIELS